MKSDPFTLEIIKRSLIVASEEMFYAFGRTAMSPVIYEVLDYAVGITDSKGELLAQAPGVPGFSGVLDFVASETLEKFGKDLREGDVIASNVPYYSGTHLNDVALSMPVFHGDELVGLVLNKGHWSEVGGMHFGSWTSDSTEIFQEGLLLPAVKIYSEGKPNKDVIDLILANNRLPRLTKGDMEAQIASMKVAARRVRALIDKYGLDSVKQAMGKIIEDGERAAKLKLKELPKGTFEAEDYIDDDGFGNSEVYVRVKVTIDDDSFTADFTGSGQQVKGSINSPFPATVSAVRETYMAVTDPHAEPNGGFFKPIKVIAPSGSIFNPIPPAPTSTYWESMAYATDLVWKALAPHIPQKLSAGHFLSILATILGGVDDRTGEPFAIVEPQPGGWGGWEGGDGESGLVACGDGETYIASNEVYERRLPVRVERYELNVSDGTGHGKFRGGFGVRKDYKVLSNKAYLTLSIGRSKFPPWGVGMGLNGTPNYAVIIKSNGESMKVRRIANYEMLKGDLVSLRSGGGGGWGDPLERDPKLVATDVKNEYITIEQARNIYGVVIDPRSSEVDYKETQALREKLKEQRGRK
ncbi:MAG: hydantoinase B/oxoprolinase family protein [Thermoprotei archaeon]|jgi:N-methylhydantoinase B|nr:hydantoinase B/oxoprolinase family protein [Thermoprotei archaeon]